MCPACLAAAVLIAAKVSSVGSLAAFVTNKLSVKSGPGLPSPQTVTPPAR